MSAKSNAPYPVNEVVRHYEPGSKDRASLKAELAAQSARVREIPLRIGGDAVRQGRLTESIVCPHNKTKVLATAAVATTQDVDQAIDAALTARGRWAALPWEERASVFLKAADLFAGKYRAAINAATILGQSKTVIQAELDAACELIDFLRFNVHFAQHIYEQQPLYSPLGMWNRSVARPLEGFVFAVCPFNFTSIVVNLAVSPALMGCTVVWKPPYTSALSASIALDVLHEAGLPAGVINLVLGEPSLIGERVLAHPDLAGIHFTGSTKTFDHLWREVGSKISSYHQYPRMVGETGGKDFVFAHPSADVEQLATALVRGAFEYQGQKCSAASRAYIPKSLWPRLKERLLALTAEIKMGDPADFSNFMGAVIDAPAYARISGAIARARQDSRNTLIAGGECDDSKGFFIRPTIFTTTDPHDKLMVEELFGPVLAIYPYDDSELDNTLRLCDQSTAFALTGAIFARDRLAIHKMTCALENAAGNFYINDKPTGAVVGQQPFGGARRSGTNDKAGSMFNLLRWVSHRTIKENFLPITDYRYPHMGEP